MRMSERFVPSGIKERGMIHLDQSDVVKERHSTGPDRSRAVGRNKKRSHYYDNRVGLTTKERATYV